MFILPCFPRSPCSSKKSMQGLGWHALETREKHDLMLNPIVQCGQLQKVLTSSKMNQSSLENLWQKTSLFTPKQTKLSLSGSYQIQLVQNWLDSLDHWGLVNTQRPWRMNIVSFHCILLYVWNGKKGFDYVLDGENVINPKQMFPVKSYMKKY